MPAPTNLEKPLARRGLIRLQSDVGDCLASREDRVEARRSREAEVGAHADAMEVPVDQPRQHAAAVQVDHLSPLFRQSQDPAVRTGGENLSVMYRNRIDGRVADVDR